MLGHAASPGPTEGKRTIAAAACQPAGSQCVLLHRSTIYSPTILVVLVRDTTTRDARRATRAPRAAAAAAPRGPLDGHALCGLAGAACHGVGGHLRSASARVCGGALRSKLGVCPTDVSYACCWGSRLAGSRPAALLGSKMGSWLAKPSLYLFNVASFFGCLAVLAGFVSGQSQISTVSPELVLLCLSVLVLWLLSCTGLVATWRRQGKVLRMCVVMPVKSPCSRPAGQSCACHVLAGFADCLLRPTVTHLLIWL